LVVLTRDQVAAVPLARCAILAKSCGVCVALQDPYCAWSVRDGQCISLVNSDPDRLDSAAFLQNVFTGQHEGCGHDSSLEATGDLAQTGIRIFLPGKNNEEFHPQASGSFVKAPAVQEKDQQTGIDLEEKENFQDAGLPGLTTTPLEPHAHYSAEELSMAVATSCVCALVLGFITGFLMSRRCSCSPRDDDNPYHVPYLNQSGYHTDEIYAKVDDMTYYPVNSMILPPNNSTGSTSMGSGQLGGHGTLGHLHASGLPSGIPTPPGQPAGMGSVGCPLPSSKTLTMSHHMNLLNPRPSDFHANFGTVHRSQKIYL